MTEAERDLLVTVAKILRTNLAKQLKNTRSKSRKDELDTDYAQLCGALSPFDHDQPQQPQPQAGTDQV